MGKRTGEHKKREDINMRNISINNLKTLCVNQTPNLKHSVNAEYLLNYTYTQLCETLVWEYYQKLSAFYKIDTSSYMK